MELGEGLVVDVVDTGRPSGTPPDGPAALLIHGIGMTSASLEPLAAALAPTHRAVCVTLPGHGSTPRPPRGLAIEDYAAVAGAVADRLGLRAVIAVGHSMGTQIGVELARSRPELVVGTVLIGPVVDDRHPTAVGQATALAVDSTRERPLTNLIVLRDYLRCGIRWYATALGPMLDYPMRERAADVAVPSVVVRGSGDPIAGADWIERLAKAMPNGRAATLTGVHHVQLAVPDDVAALVRSLADDRSPAIRQGPARPAGNHQHGNTTTLDRRSNA